MADFDVNAPKSQYPPDIVATELGKILKQRQEPGAEKLYLCTYKDGKLIAATEQQIATLDLTRLPIKRIVAIVQEAMKETRSLDQSRIIMTAAVALLKGEKTAKGTYGERIGRFFSSLMPSQKAPPQPEVTTTAPNPLRLEADRMRVALPNIVKAQDVETVTKNFQQTSKEFAEKSIKGELDKVDTESGCLAQTKTDADAITFVIKDGEARYNSPPPLVIKHDTELAKQNRIESDKQETAAKKTHLDQYLGAIDSVRGDHDGKWRKSIQALCTQSPFNMLMGSLRETMSKRAADDELNVKATKYPIELTINREHTGKITSVDFKVNGSLDLYSGGKTPLQMPAVFASVTGKLTYSPSGELNVHVDPPNYQIVQ